MTKKSERLEKAMKHSRSLPEDFFGEGTGLTFEDLPCIKEKSDEKIKKTYRIRSSVISKLEKVSESYGVAVGDLISDIIDKAI